MTFMEYLKGIRPRALKVGYLGKELGAILGVAFLFAFALVFGIPWEGTTHYNPLFLLMLIGVPFLILYTHYCETHFYRDFD